MEHHWDEAYGYFGAASDFYSYSDQDLSSGTLWKDSNGDGSVDLQSEYNFTWAGYSGKRDVGGTGIDFSGDIFQAFLEGRTAIVNQASAAEIAEQRDVIVRKWEQLVAANVVHYINDTLEDLGTITQAQIDAKNNESLNEHWAEGKGFAFALQFNPFKTITNAQLEQLHTLISDVPPYALPGTEASDAVIDDLNAAKALLQSVYGFSDANMTAW